MASITEQLKKFAARITTAAHPTEVPGQSIDEVLSFITKNINTDSDGKIIVKSLDVGNSEPEVVALTAFKNGDVYQNGTRIIFPKSQMDNLDAFFRDKLANWTFGEDFDMLHQKGSSGGLFSLMNAGGVGVFLLPTSGMVDGMIWFSEAMSNPDIGVNAEAGWQYQNLVDEGDYYSFTANVKMSAEVDTETDFDGKAYLDQWNGIMIGLDNSQVQEQPEAVALTAFKNGDVVQNGTRFIFPKSQMDNLEALLRDIVANWTYGEDFNMLDENETTGGLLNIMNSGDVFYSLMAPAPAPAPSDNVFSGLLWVNSDYPDADITAGWQYQNFVDEGDNYVFIVGEGISNTVNATERDFEGKPYLDQWNGIMIGIDNSQVQEQPETSGVSLVPFQIGEAFNSTGYVYFDTTKSNDEMTNLMSSLTYTNDSEALCYLMEHEHGQLINAMLYNGIYFLVTCEGDSIIIWSSDAFADMGIEGAGWHNLDEEGKIAVESDLQITNISNEFNGVIFGKGIQA